MSEVIGLGDLIEEYLDAREAAQELTGDAPGDEFDRIEAQHVVRGLPSSPLVTLRATLVAAECYIPWLFSSITGAPVGTRIRGIKFGAF